MAAVFQQKALQPVRAQPASLPKSPAALPDLSARVLQIGWIAARPRFLGSVGFAVPLNPVPTVTCRSASALRLALHLPSYPWLEGWWRK